MNVVRENRNDLKLPPRISRGQILLNSAELYSYASLSLLALDYLHSDRGVRSINAISALNILHGFRRSMSALSRFGEDDSRLPLGTFFFGKKAEIPVRYKTHPLFKKAVGPLYKLLRIWPDRVKKTKHP